MFEGRCGIIEMMDTGILDLDREHDFELMEVVAQYLYESNSDFPKV
jgi:CMP-N,N'-diacetyllegionaminic acid synthase